jgi:hypothetical protein
MGSRISKSLAIFLLAFKMQRGEAEFAETERRIQNLMICFFYSALSLLSPLLRVAFRASEEKIAELLLDSIGVLMEIEEYLEHGQDAHATTLCKW